MTRYIAHITIKADTPLKVGSGSSDFLHDSPIQRDWNGLPMILGTSIAGVLRKDFKKIKLELVDDLFGSQDAGSKLIFSNALLLNGEKKVHEDLLLDRTEMEIFDTLPLREHVAISSKGTVDGRGKFDEEVLYKGSMFKFSIEMIEEYEELFETILNLLASPSFRLGGGSTKGFGKFKIENITTASRTLENYSSSLNTSLDSEYSPKKVDSDHTLYRLEIKPDDFFMFGSGFGDTDANMTPVYEKEVEYSDGKVVLGDEKMLIPASSIKGAIAHRTTYHYNKENDLYIGNSEARESISEIFGKAKNSKKNITGAKGKLIFSDCLEAKVKTKVFDHVSIDRFTGGAIDGALFQEKTVASTDNYTIEILLEKGIDNVCVKAFEEALIDICTGMLPLGGATTKGHGIFCGSLKKDGHILHEGKCDNEL